MSSSKKHRFIPPDGLRCIWMTAGILSYQLCDRSYDCDNCTLDAAMRNHFSRQANANPDAEPRPVPAAAAEKLREGFLYGRNHSWTWSVGERALRVGIEPGLSQALLAPKAVVFPSLNQHLQRGQTCLWIVMAGGTLPFESPVSGTVRRNNRMLADRPHLLNANPFDEGWLYEMEPDPGSVPEAKLMRAEAAGIAYGEDEAHFMRLLGNAAQRNRPGVGNTLADGVQRLRGIVLFAPSAV
jgi:glycine cleavage system H protein